MGDLLAKYAEKLIMWFQNNGVSAIIIALAVLLIFCIIYAEQVLLWKSEILGLFSHVSSRAKKGQISNKVRGTVLKAVKEQSLTNRDVLPNDLKVVWVNDENEESFIQNNQVIVRVKHSSNPNANLVTAVSEYVNKGLLYNVKRYLDGDIIKASKILMTRKIIQSANKNSLTYLDEKCIIPQLHADQELKELYEDLLQIDHNGMFVGILLNEFQKAGMSIYGEIEDPELVAESKEFMRYLYNIAMRISDEISDLIFNRDYFKVAILLSAKDKTIKYQGIKPFVRAASKLLGNGIETIYVFGLGRKQEVAKQISEEIRNDIRIDDIKKHSYKHLGKNGKRVSGVFYECWVYKEPNE